MAHCAHEAPFWPSSTNAPPFISRFAELMSNALGLAGRMPTLRILPDGEKIAAKFEPYAEFGCHGELMLAYDSLPCYAASCRCVVPSGRQSGSGVEVLRP